MIGEKSFQRLQDAKNYVGIRENESISSTIYI